MQYIQQNSILISGCVVRKFALEQKVLALKKSLAIVTKVHSLELALLVKVFITSLVLECCSVFATEIPSLSLCLSHAAAVTK